MRKTLLSVLGFCLSCLLASAQVDFVFMEARGGVSATGKDATLYCDQFLLQVKGKLTPTLTYQLRQRFSKPIYDAKNPLNATDILRLVWDVTPRWTLEAGKIPVYIGGYEWDDAPMEVYYWNDFATNIDQVYALGTTGYYKVKPGQQLLLQFSHSLLHRGNPDIFHATLGWTGQFAPWWKTLWSVNWMDDPYHHHMGYLALGNRFEAGAFAVELDGMYRRSFRQASAGFDGSAALRLSYTPNAHWNLFAKGGGDYNDAANVDGNGIAYDLPVAPGTRYLYGGGGIEYYPLGTQDLRLLAVAWADNRSKLLNLRLGLTFRLHIIRPTL